MPQDRRASRTKVGMRRCNNNNCNCCPFVLETDKVTSAASKFSVKLLEPVNCETKNVVYCLSCTKQACKGIQYIGETHRKFQKRFSEHVRYVKGNMLTQPTGTHFNLPGHTIILSSKNARGSLTPTESKGRVTLSTNLTPLDTV